MTRAFQSEAELGAAVARYMKRQGFGVYAEPDCGVPEVPDLAGVSRFYGLLICECKLGLEWKAIAQAAAWWAHANNCVVAVPYSPRYLENSREADLIRRVCKAERVGLWLVGDNDRVTVSVPPIQNPNARNIGILDVLMTLPQYDPATATKHPGTPGRAERPELAEARQRLWELVNAHQGQRVRCYWDLLAEMFTPRIADRVIDAAKHNKVAGIRAERHSFWRLYLAEKQENAA